MNDFFDSVGGRILFIIVLFIIIASSTRAFWVTFFIFVILPAVALYVYSLYRKNVKQKGEDIKLANEMEAKKDTIIAFKKSEDYQLLTKYVQIYPNSDYKRDRNYHLQTLRQVITSRWTISEEEITNFGNGLYGLISLYWCHATYSSDPVPPLR